MKYTTHDAEMQTYINQILESRSINVTLTQDCCKKLLAYGKQRHDTYLIGFAYYFLGESYYFTGDSRRQLVFLFKAMKYLESSQNWSLLARCYNLLGILSSSQGNSTAAVDYFLDGLNLCTSYSLYYVAGMIYSNLSILYTELQMYEKAIDYQKKSLENFKKDTDDSLGQNCCNNLCISYLSMAQSYLRLGNLAEASACMDEIKDYLPTISYDYAGVSIAVVKTMLFHAQGDFDMRDTCIQEILSLLTQEHSLLTLYDDFLTISHFLLDIENYSALLQILNTLETMAVHAQNMHIQLEILKIKLSYYKKTNQDSLFLHTACQFYELHMKQEEENVKITASSIELRFSLAQLQNRQKMMEYENQKLVLKSESDALTGLPNRYKLNEYSETLLNRAKENEACLGVEILDIDYFKEYNDTYGHQAGDACLVAIAGELKTMMSDDIFCARYGGDEFIIIYYNKTQQEIRFLAEDLRRRVCNLKIAHSGSLSQPYITITQGILYHLPSTANRMWDYLHAADNALYEGKNNSRNSITMNTIS